MNAENIRRLELAAEQLDGLDHEFMFVGGATVELWITDVAAPEFRPTDDVDVTVEIATLAQYHSLESELRKIGLKHDIESGVVCRFRDPGSDLVLDVMPTEPSILGFVNRWQEKALPHAVGRSLPSGRLINVISPPFLLASKLEAFQTRGKGDFYGSRDFGDVVSLLDGREELGDELAESPKDLRAFVGDTLADLSRSDRFENGVEGALPLGPETGDRLACVLLPRIRSIIAAGH